MPSLKTYVSTGTEPTDPLAERARAPFAVPCAPSPVSAICATARVRDAHIQGDHRVDDDRCENLFSILVTYVLATNYCTVHQRNTYLLRDHAILAEHSATSISDRPLEKERMTDALKSTDRKTNRPGMDNTRSCFRYYILSVLVLY